MEAQTVSGEGVYRYGYDEMGRNAYLEYPDGHVRRQQYDELGRLTSRCYEYGSDVRCYTAQYDAVGNPVRMTDPDGSDTVEYDALDRLKKVTRDVGGNIVSVEDYDYNALGALKLNAGIPLDHQRPRLDGAGLADAAVPNSIGGQSIVLDAGGRITSLRGNTFTWFKDGSLRQIQPPTPAIAERYGIDAERRRTAKIQGSTVEFYVYEELNRIATIDPTGAAKESYLFDGIDHPLRIRRGSITAYYELDLAGNVRGLRLSGGADLGAYRYTAFGKTVEDTASANLDQPLRWKGRWYSPVAGGTYDVRARQWSPELGAFLSVDEYEFQDRKSTLWGWPNQNPVKFADPSGRFAAAAVAGGGVAAAAGAALSLWAAWDCAVNGCQGIKRVMDDLLGKPCPLEMAKGGKQNVNHPHIWAEARNADPEDPCRALQKMRMAAKKSGDTELMQKIKQTQKANDCRHSSFSK